MRSESDEKDNPMTIVIMKTFLFALALFIALPFQSVRAASPAEETRLLAAAKSAFAKHDADALIALTCWDRVPDDLKESGKLHYTKEVVLSVTDITLSAPDPTMPDVEWKDGKGVAYRSNLPVTKHLKITFVPGSMIELKRGPVKVKDVTYSVGEKDGKLYLLEPAPVIK
jgi:hypothetical protein